MASKIAVRPVAGKADFNTFVDLAYTLNAGDPHWVPPLRSEAAKVLTPAKNPFFAHATVQLFVAWRGEQPVGRISAHIDHLALEQPREQGMGPGTGNWGMFEAADRDVANALLATAESWLRDQGMTRALGPLSLSIWEEPGLLTRGHNHSPMIMMGHDNAAYQGWVESAGHGPVKRLLTYEVPVSNGFPKIVQRIVKSGERNDKIVIRELNMSRYDEEALLILSLLNEAWSANWGFVPLTDAEIAEAQKSLKPVVMDGMNVIAEYDGEPAAFMLSLPDIYEAIKPLNGRLLPFGWARLLYRLWRKRWHGFRVPLMGVSLKHQNSRLAGQLAFMMIERIRQKGVDDYNVQRAEVGWVLEDNRGMVAVAEAINGKINRVYTLYEKQL